MTREEAIDIRQRSLNGERVDINQLDEAMRVIATPEGRRELPAGATTNPWRLSLGMCEVLNTVIRTGDYHEAARELDIAPSGISMQLSRAAERMNAPNRIRALIEWDRLVRSEQ
jgi:DNA-binding NarL/FixJ family response regulator